MNHVERLGVALEIKHPPTTSLVKWSLSWKRSSKTCCEDPKITFTLKRIKIKTELTGEGIINRPTLKQTCHFHSCLLPRKNVYNNYFARLKREKTTLQITGIENMVVDISFIQRRRGEGVVIKPK